MLISSKTTRLFSILFSPKEAQLLFRQLQKLSARNIAALKCESRKNQMLGTLDPFRFLIQFLWLIWRPFLMLKDIVFQKKMALSSYLDLCKNIVHAPWIWTLSVMLTLTNFKYLARTILSSSRFQNSETAPSLSYMQIMHNYANQIA